MKWTEMQELLTPTLPSETTFTLLLMKERQENPGAIRGQPRTPAPPSPKGGSSLNEHGRSSVKQKRVSAACAWRSRLRPQPSSFLGLPQHTLRSPKLSGSPQILAALSPSPGGRLKPRILSFEARGMGILEETSSESQSQGTRRGPKGAGLRSLKNLGLRLVL